MEYNNKFPAHYKNYNIEDIEGECWKEIQGFEGLYLISNMGRVKVLNRQQRGFPQIMKLSTTSNKSGYIMIQLYKSNKPFTKQVHRLVAKAFIPNPFDLAEVNHIKGFKYDNRASELEWCTRQQNIHHAYNVLFRNSGTDHFRSKFNESQVLEIVNSELTHRELGKIYGVSHTTIGQIKRKKSYKVIINGLN